MFTLAVSPPGGGIEIPPFSEPKLPDFLRPGRDPSKGLAAAFLAFGLRQTFPALPHQVHVVLVLAERVHAEAAGRGIADPLTVEVRPVDPPTEETEKLYTLLHIN